MSEQGYYQLNIVDKRVTPRLKHPFPSNCTEGDNGENIFPGSYTVRKCYDTCALRQMLTECKTVIDAWRKYVPGLHSTNETWDTSAECLRRIAFSSKYPSWCHCPFSCFETSFDTSLRRLYPIPYSNYAEIQINYERNTFTLVQEIEAYPKNKFLTDIGGWCGLFTGMSLMSLVEMFVFLLLAVMALCRKWRALRFSRNMII